MGLIAATVASAPTVLPRGSRVAAPPVITPLWPHGLELSVPRAAGYSPRGEEGGGGPEGRLRGLMGRIKLCGDLI